MPAASLKRSSTTKKSLLQTPNAHLRLPEPFCIRQKHAATAKTTSTSPKSPLHPPKARCNRRKVIYILQKPAARTKTLLDFVKKTSTSAKTSIASVNMTIFCGKLYEKPLCVSQRPCLLQTASEMQHRSIFHRTPCQRAFPQEQPQTQANDISQGSPRTRRCPQPP